MNNMVFEDAQMILSYASPYKVTMNLERENKAPSSRTPNKRNKLNKRALGSDSYQKTMLHPLYRTRSVDNLVQLGKYDKQPNYGTASHRRLHSQALYPSSAGNAYSRMIGKFKQQLLTYLQDSGSTHAEHVDQPVDQQQANTTDSVAAEKKQSSQLMRPLTSIQNLFKPNRLNWPEEYSGQNQNHLNSVVVGNSLALGNPGFCDEDEDDEFQKEYQLSQLKYQQQYAVPTIQQQQPPSNNNALRHQNSLQAAAHYSRSSQPTNLIKYHQQTMTDLSQVDSVQAMNQFVNVNLNDLNQRQRARHEEMDYSNSVRKGNSTTQLNDLNKSLTSSSQFISVPLTLADEHTSEQQQQQQQTNQQLPNTTVAEVHAAADRSSVDAQSKSPPIDSESKSANKPRSSSMSDLPNQSVVSMHPEATSASASNQYQSTLERAISLDLSNSTADQQTAMNSKLSKSVFTGKFSKQPDDHQSRHRRLIKSKNQANLNQQPQKHSSSLGDITYEQSLTHSLSNGKLSNQSKSIRNSLSSTNSTCSSPSLPSGSSDMKMEYDDHSILMLKSSPEENNSILIREQRLEEPSILDQRRVDDELDGKESILFVSDQHKTNTMMDSRQQTERDPSMADDQLFANKEQAKKILNDVFTMSSIRTLNAIKSDKQLNDLFRSNPQANESAVEHSAGGRPKSNREIIPNKEITPNIANFKISSTKKEIPVRISSLSTSDHSSTNPFSSSSNVPSRDNLFANNDRSDQSINKENDQQLNRPDSSSSITDDEIAQLKNRVSKLKKEFSLRQKQIESQNKQSSVNNKFRRSTSEQQQAKQVLSENSRPGKRPPTGSISKKQEQILNSTTIDFESWSWKQDS